MGSVSASYLPLPATSGYVSPTATYVSPAPAPAASYVSPAPAPAASYISPAAPIAYPAPAPADDDEAPLVVEPDLPYVRRVVVQTTIATRRRVEPIIALAHQIEHIERVNRILQRSYGAIDTTPQGSGKTYITGIIAQQRRLQLLVICPSMVVSVWENMIIDYNLPYVDVITYQDVQGRGAILSQYLTATNQPTERYLAMLREGIYLVVDEAQNIKNKSLQWIHVRAMVNALIVANAASRYTLLSGSLIDKMENAVQLLYVTGHIQHVSLSIGAQGLGIAELITHCSAIDRDLTTTIVNTITISRATRIRLVYQLFLQVIMPSISSSAPPPIISASLDVKNTFLILPEMDLRLYMEGIGMVRKAIGAETEVAHSAIAASDIVPRGTFNIGDVAKGLVTIELAKAYVTAQLALSYLRAPNNFKVVIAFNYYESLDVVASLIPSSYGVLVVTGRTSDRDASIELFQDNDNKHRVLLITSTVGGVGISLHDTHGGFPRALLVMPSYTLLQLIQVVYRVYRVGTKSPAYVRIIYAEARYREESLLAAIRRKSEVLSDVITPLTGSRVRMLLPGEFDEEHQQLNGSFALVRPGAVAERKEIAGGVVSSETAAIILLGSGRSAAKRGTAPRSLPKRDVVGEYLARMGPQ